MNNKRWRNTGLYALLFIVLIALGTAFLDKQPEARKTWRYSQFIQAVENNRVEKVSISPDRKQALVTPKDETSKRLVTLVNDPELIATLSAKGVGIDVLPQSDDGFWFKALSSLFFPVLLLVGLFFYYVVPKVVLVARR
ncbi:Cell division protein FtsH [Richelia intracellularis HH01]|uniref:Cell division protein FtsH n=1 Tax=Richelia intracellularis HH01 TaxID=1165094 RepID=M1WYT9_9NOST|nr:Cell division protein FtsH [Richelia intracellularis HH01]